MDKKDFKVINCKNLKEEKKKEKNKFLQQKYYDLYLDYQYGFEKIPDKKKAIYYGIKYIAKSNVDVGYQQLLKMFTEMCDIESLISNITFGDFISLFPVAKEYDKTGEMKDYYSTMEYLEDKKMDEIIFENIDSLFWNYYNNDIISYNVKKMLIISRIQKYENGTDLMETLLSHLDPDNKIDTYIYNKEHNYIQNRRTGKITKVKQHKRIPKYLKVIKT